MTKSQINRLGGRLRAGPVTDDLLAELQAFRGRYATPMLTVQSILSDVLGFETTARLKTTNTIVEKLRRDKTRLSEMQDIGGVRLIGDWTLRDQDDVVKQILTLFPTAGVQDRREKPSHGYRAVHVVAVVEGCPIEIQVRSLEQDGWAQSMEKLADSLGREIRYGGGSEEARPVVDLMTGPVSEAIAKYESLRNTVQLGRKAVAVAGKILAVGWEPTSGQIEEIGRRIDDINRLEASALGEARARGPAWTADQEKDFLRQLKEQLEGSNLPKLERQERAMAQKLRELLARLPR